MKPIITLVYFLHLIIMIVAVFGEESPPIYTPVDDITVNCGYSGNLFNEYDNRNWTGDINSKFSPLEHEAAAAGNTSVFKRAPLTSSSTRQVPYTTARLSHSEFTYRFHLATSGQKFIRLYFNPVSYANFSSINKALFSVEAGGNTLLKDFNASETAKANGVKTLFKEFCVNIYETEKTSLNLTFTPSRRARTEAYAFINGIEIVSIPSNLYNIEGRGDGVSFVGNLNNFRAGYGSTLETVYRINVGGSSIRFNKDTGIYRSWDGGVEEQKYLDLFSLRYSVVPQNPSIDLNFSRIPEYSAPKQVYQTGRSMGNNKSRNLGYNLTWMFPVDTKFMYLVRLHLCEFQPEILVPGDRVFVIYIDTQVAERQADIIRWSGGNGIPIFRDYVVFMDAGPAGSQLEKVNLSIALQANPTDWMTGYNDALLNGLEIFKISDANGNFIRPRADSPKVVPSSPRKHKSRTAMQITIVAAVVSCILVLSSLLVLGFLILRLPRKAKSTNGSSLPPYLCRYFSLSEIKAATHNFNDTFLIGVGGFGNVYRGYIDGGGTPVAIKRLKPESSQGALEFKTELELLSQLRHRHLVSLIGYCSDKGEMILVYDYMVHGTLADHIYHKDNPPLSWEKRLQICIGAARGLQYLHSGANGTIIHRDVKSTNILLDEKWVAKVSDFGLSKMGTTDTSKTHISTVVKGSFGYLDPEYYQLQRLTEKSDVYSFGVVLCEVLCGRPAVMHAVELRQMNLAQWARSCHRDGELDQMIDPSIRGKIEAECLNKFVEIAMSCMHDHAVGRPSMNDVVKGLEFSLELHQNCIERKGDNEISFINDNTSSEQSCVTNESITCISGTIFSEINDPSGR